LHYVQANNDWEPFTQIGMGGGGVLSVGATSPLSSTGGQNPVVSINLGMPGQYLRCDGFSWSAGPILSADVSDLSMNAVSARSGYHQIDQTIMIGPNTTGTVTVSCGGNDLPISGGCTSTDSMGGIVVLQSTPNFANGNASWTCLMKNNVNIMQGITARVVCYTHP
jgi:hypothetical protein